MERPIQGDPWSALYEHGRFLEEWAAPDVVRGLRNVFPRYDAAEIWTARFPAVDLFRSLAEETWARLGYAYPHELERKVMSWVEALAQDSRDGRPTGV